MASSPPGCLPLLAAAFAAALVAPFWFGDADLAPLVFIAAFILATIHIALIAGPVYFWLERRLRPTFGAVLVAATLVGGVPMPFLAALAGDWPEAAMIGLCFGSCGLAGGLAFWLVLNFRRPPKEEGRPG